MTPSARHSIRKWATVALTLAAFGLSWQHTHEWVRTWGPSDPGAIVLASIPEVLVLITVLSLPEGRRDPKVWITGGSAVAFTLWANGAQARPGVSGLVVAVAPALAALAGAALVGHGVTPDPAPVATPAPQPVAKKAPAARPPVAQHAPWGDPTDLQPTMAQVRQHTADLATVHALPAAQPRPVAKAQVATESAPSGKLASAIAWGQHHQSTTDTTPTWGQIAAGAGVSEKTAKRARAELGRLGRPQASTPVEG